MLVVSSLVAAGVVAFCGAPAVASEGIADSGHATWLVRPDDGEVAVTISVDVTLTARDTSTSYVYLDTYGVALPYAPDELTATWDGTEVTPSLEPLDSGLTMVTINIPGTLRSGQSGTAVVDAVFTSAPPRSEPTAGPRVQPEYVFTRISSWGDQASAEVRVPDDLDGDPPDEWEQSRDDGDRVFTNDEFDAGVLVPLMLTGETTPSQELTTKIDGHTITVLPWSNDTEWGDRVLEFTEQAVPAIGAAIGDQEVTSDFAIREDASPEAAGYGGWYDDETDEILMGERFNRELWTHELLHHWFNGDEFSQTWMAEGMAELTTASLADQFGYETDEPTRHDDVDLALWDFTLLAQQELQQEDPQAWQELLESHYDTAHSLLREIREEIGPKQWDRVVAGLMTERSPFDGPGDEQVREATDWRELIDLVEAESGWSGSDDLLREHVASGEAIDARNTAWAAWHEFVEADWQHRDWAPPLAGRRAMQAWEHDRALEVIARAVEVQEQISGLSVVAEERGLEVAPPRKHYETGDLATISTPLETMQTAVDAVGAVQDRATERDVDLPLIATKVTVDTAADVTARAQRVGDVMDTVVKVSETTPPDGLLATVGLLGTDTPTEIEAARQALATNRLDDAQAHAAAVLDTWDGADQEGRRRASIVGATLAAVLVLLVLLRWRRRRRAARLAAAEASIDDSIDGAAMEVEVQPEDDVDVDPQPEPRPPSTPPGEDD